MNKHLIRVVSLLLVICITDQTWAVDVFQRAITPVHIADHQNTAFSQQALSIPDSSARFLGRPVHAIAAIGTAVIFLGLTAQAVLAQPSPPKNTPPKSQVVSVQVDAPAEVELWHGLSQASGNEVSGQLRLALSRALATYNQRARAASTDAAALRSFAIAFKNGLRITNLIDPNPGYAHFKRRAGVITAYPVINWPTVKPLLDRAVQGDAAAQDQITQIFIQVGRIFQTQGGTALFNYLTFATAQLTHPASKAPLDAIVRIAETWGLSLSPDWGSQSVGGSFIQDFANSSTTPGQVHLRADVIFSIGAFRDLVRDTAQPSSLLVQSKRNLFLALVIKEGRGAVDFFERTNAYLDLYNEAIQIGLRKFNGHPLNATDSSAINQALLDRTFVDRVYQHTSRLVYGEVLGYDALLQFIDFLALTDSQLNSLVSGEPSRNLVGRIKSLRAITRNVSAADRNRNLRGDVFMNDLAVTAPGERHLIIQDSINHGIIRADANGKMTGNFSQWPFLTDPRYSHENDYRPVPQKALPPKVPSKNKTKAWMNGPHQALLFDNQKKSSLESDRTKWFGIFRRIGPRAGNIAAGILALLAIYKLNISGSHLNLMSIMLSGELVFWFSGPFVWLSLTFYRRAARALSRPANKNRRAFTLGLAAGAGAVALPAIAQRLPSPAPQVQIQLSIPGQLAADIATHLLQIGLNQPSLPPLGRLMEPDYWQTVAKMNPNNALQASVFVRAGNTEIGNRAIRLGVNPNLFTAAEQITILGSYFVTSVGILNMQPSSTKPERLDGFLVDMVQAVFRELSVWNTVLARSPATQIPQTLILQSEWEKSLTLLQADNAAMAASFRKLISTLSRPYMRPNPKGSGELAYGMALDLNRTLNSLGYCINVAVFNNPRQQYRNGASLGRIKPELSFRTLNQNYQAYGMNELWAAAPSGGIYPHVNGFSFAEVRRAYGKRDYAKDYGQAIYQLLTSPRTNQAMQSSYFFFKHPILKTIADNTFAGFNAAQIASAILRDILIHELLHCWTFDRRTQALRRDAPPYVRLVPQIGVDRASRILYEMASYMGAMALSDHASLHLYQWLQNMSPTSQSVASATDEMIMSDQLFREFAMALLQKEPNLAITLPAEGLVFSQMQAAEIAQAALKLGDKELKNVATDIFNRIFGELPPIPQAQRASVAPYTLWGLIAESLGAFGFLLGQVDFPENPMDELRRFVKEGDMDPMDVAKHLKDAQLLMFSPDEQNKILSGILDMIMMRFSPQNQIFVQGAIQELLKNIDLFGQIPALDGARDKLKSYSRVSTNHLQNSTLEAAPQPPPFSEDDLRHIAAQMASPRETKPDPVVVGRVPDSVRDAELKTVRKFGATLVPSPAFPPYPFQATSLPDGGIRYVRERNHDVLTLEIPSNGWSLQIYEYKKGVYSKMEWLSETGILTIQDAGKEAVKISAPEGALHAIHATAGTSNSSPITFHVLFKDALKFHLGGVRRERSAANGMFTILIENIALESGSTNRGSGGIRPKGGLRSYIIFLVLALGSAKFIGHEMNLMSIGLPDNLASLIHFWIFGSLTSLVASAFAPSRNGDTRGVIVRVTEGAQELFPQLRQADPELAWMVDVSRGRAYYKHILQKMGIFDEWERGKVFLSHNVRRIDRAGDLLEMFPDLLIILPTEVVQVTIARSVLMIMRGVGSRPRYPETRLADWQEGFGAVVELLEKIGIDRRQWPKIEIVGLDRRPLHWNDIVRHGDRLRVQLRQLEVAA